MAKKGKDYADWKRDAGPKEGFWERGENGPKLGKTIEKEPLVSEEGGDPLEKSRRSGETR